MRFFLSCLMAFMMFAAPAFAMDLTSAKSSGLVGEMPNGLIGVVTPPASPDIQALIDTVNTGRTKIYQENAKEQNVPLNQVQAIAGANLIEKTPSGQYVQTPNGQWVKK